MEGASGSCSNSVPIDKTRVLDVKPLRYIVPVFAQTPQVPPVVCSSPNGPYPPGFTPFFPFSTPQGLHEHAGSGRTAVQDGGFTTPSGAMPAPLRSYRPPEPVSAIPRRFSNGGSGSSMDGFVSDQDGFSSGKKRAGRASQRRSGKKAAVSLAPGATQIAGLELTLQEDGNREVVDNLLIMYDALRRRMSQLEDSKEASTGLVRRADLKASNILMSKGLRTNKRRRIGSVPGVEIGDIFFFRMELCLVGLHAPSMGGIDYMIVKNGLEEEPVALCIVSSGGYDDDAEDKDVLVYSGQGGANKKEASHQKLERGNLALERSLQRGSEVRVVRGMRDAVNPLAKVYIYDGLYNVQESWVDKGKTGGSTFKYKLLRVPGQPSAFAVWKSVQKWKEGFASREGLILPDLTSGAESAPVSLVNDVDDEKGPAYFTYFPSLKYSKSFKLAQSTYGCNCHKACVPGDLNCSCIQKNGGDFPYTTNGVLVSRKSLLYECGPTCPCFPNCKNRVSQTGLKVRLEVFKTNDRGWGLRSWDPIRAGTFICEYAGEVIDASKAKNLADEGENEYIFDTTRVYDISLKWNYDPLLLDEEGGPESNEDVDIPGPLVISAKNVGNVARFMNHSCYPNVFWQPIMYEQNNDSFLHIGFYAVKHIPPMTELTYDYGISQSDTSSSSPRGKKKCLCASAKCRGYFG